MGVAHFVTISHYSVCYNASKCEYQGIHHLSKIMVSFVIISPQLAAANHNLRNGLASLPICRKLKLVGKKMWRIE